TAATPIIGSADTTVTPGHTPMSVTHPLTPAAAKPTPPSRIPIATSRRAKPFVANNAKIAANDTRTQPIAHDATSMPATPAASGCKRVPPAVPSRHSRVIAYRPSPAAAIPTSTHTVIVRPFLVTVHSPSACDD